MSSRLQRHKATLLVVLVLILSALHFAIPVRTHPLHVIHVIFQGLYLLPIVAAAVWFGRRGGVGTAVAVSVLYSTHILVSWAHQPMENVNQVAMIGVFLAVGTIAGVLVDRQESERRRRVEAEQRAAREGIVQAFAGLLAALGVRDEYTRVHSEHVASLAVRIGRARGLPDEQVEALRLAALVHDIGKIGVRDDILLKPHELSREERAMVERHPVVAAEILRAIGGTAAIADIVLCHHECPDGSGYPRGLYADQIPTAAAVLRVADVFSALTEQRVYKAALTIDAALDHMSQLAGTKLDGVTVQTLRTIVISGDQ